MSMGRMVRPVDFQRVLGTAPWARSVHFAVHHLPQAPSRPSGKATAANSLSTGPEQACPQAVEETAPEVLVEARLARCWLGLVVPKRHAKRSVTRNLLKRQIRAAVGRVQAAGQPLRPGMWVIRLRSPIDRKRFPSAASDALREVVRAELQHMMVQAVQRCHG